MTVTGTSQPDEDVLKNAVAATKMERMTSGMHESLAVAVAVDYQMGYVVVVVVAAIVVQGMTAESEKKMTKTKMR